MYGNDDTSYESLLSIKTLRKTPDVIWKYYSEFYNSVVTARESMNSTTYTYMRDVIMPQFPDSIILTQNIDGFINIVPSKYVTELHGNINFMFCEKCGKKIPIDFDNKQCQCGQECRPFVLLFGENLWCDCVYTMSIIKKQRPKFLIVIGTTLQFGYLGNFIKNSKIPHVNRYIIDPNKDTILRIQAKTRPNKRKKQHFWLLNAFDGLSKFMSIDHS